MSEELQPTPRSRVERSIWKSWWTYLGLTFLAIAVVFCGLVWRAVLAAGDAEWTFHANRLVFDLISQFALQHGEWPKSWDDLASTQPSREPAIWRWPQDREEVQQRITIDFSLTKKEIALLTPQEFSAVQQRQPRYLFTPEEFDDFLKSVRDGFRQYELHEANSPK